MCLVRKLVSGCRRVGHCSYQKLGVSVELVVFISQEGISRSSVAQYVNDPALMDIG